MPDRCYRGLFSNQMFGKGSCNELISNASMLMTCRAFGGPNRRRSFTSITPNRAEGYLIDGKKMNKIIIGATAGIICRWKKKRFKNIKINTSVYLKQETKKFYINISPQNCIL